MKKKLLIILVFFPLSQYYYKKFYFKKNKKWKIQYWNLLGLYNKKIYKKFSNDKSIIKNKQFININSLNDIKKKFKKLPKSFHYISYVPYSFKFSLIDRFLKIYGGKKSIIRFSGNVNPVTTYDQLNFIRKNFNIKVLSKIILSFFRGINYIIYNEFISARPKKIFVPNQIWLNIFKKKYPKSKLIETFDYEYQIFNSLKKKDESKKFIVFVDQMADLPFDEQVLHNKSKYLNSNNYWPKLNKFLNFCEKNYQFKSLIAAHPRRNRKDLPPIDKKFIFNKTPQLIRDAALVILHTSTASRLAVLFEKPMIILTINEFEKMLGKTLEMNKISNDLNLNLINLDSYNYEKSKQLINTRLKINKKKYKDYQNKYIQFKGNKSNNIWKIVLSKLDDDH